MTKQDNNIEQTLEKEIVLDICRCQCNGLEHCLDNCKYDEHCKKYAKQIIRDVRDHDLTELEKVINGKKYKKTSMTPDYYMGLREILDDIRAYMKEDKP